MSTCKVSECRFKNSHVASVHVCGKCKKSGHGVIECGNNKLISILHKESKNDRLSVDKACTLQECDNTRWLWSRVAGKSADTVYVC